MDTNEKSPTAVHFLIITVLSEKTSDQETILKGCDPGGFLSALYLLACQVIVIGGDFVVASLVIISEVSVKRC